jgi:hypothetical protein
MRRTMEFDQAAGLYGPPLLGSTEIKNAVNSLWGGEYKPNTLAGNIGKLVGHRLPTLLLGSLMRGVGGLPSWARWL